MSKQLQKILERQQDAFAVGVIELAKEAQDVFAFGCMTHPDAGYRRNCAVLLDRAIRLVGDHVSSEINELAQRLQTAAAQAPTPPGPDDSTPGPAEAAADPAPPPSSTEAPGEQ